MHQMNGYNLKKIKKDSQYESLLKDFPQRNLTKEQQNQDLDEDFFTKGKYQGKKKQIKGEESEEEYSEDE
jgi:hypothetical protein